MLEPDSSSNPSIQYSIYLWKCIIIVIVVYYTEMWNAQHTKTPNVVHHSDWWEWLQRRMHWMHEKNLWLWLKHVETLFVNSRNCLCIGLCRAEATFSKVLRLVVHGDASMSLIAWCQKSCRCALCGSSVGRFACVLHIVEKAQSKPRTLPMWIYPRSHASDRLITTMTMK